MSTHVLRTRVHGTCPPTCVGPALMPFPSGQGDVGVPGARGEAGHRGSAVSGAQPGEWALVSEQDRWHCGCTDGPTSQKPEMPADRDPPLLVPLPWGQGRSPELPCPGVCMPLHSSEPSRGRGGSEPPASTGTPPAVDLDDDK